MGNYIAYIFMDMITYPCPDLDDGLSSERGRKGSLLIASVIPPDPGSDSFCV